MADSRLRRPRVLVVDDDESMRALLRLHLTNDGYDVLLAEDAIVGGHLALSDAPDLILLDVQMPYMNGYDLAAALKLDPMTRRIPVVFLTIDENVAEQAGSLGITGYLNKPVAVPRLLEVVRLHIRKDRELK
jgi:two-component system, OmpR family, phosphate regulon response regulator PhoB